MANRSPATRQRIAGQPYKPARRVEGDPRGAHRPDSRGVSGNSGNGASPASPRLPARGPNAVPSPHQNGRHPAGGPGDRDREPYPTSAPPASRERRGPFERPSILPAGPPLMPSDRRDGASRGGSGPLAGPTAADHGESHSALEDIGVIAPGLTERERLSARPEIRGEVGAIIDALRPVFQQDRAVASQVSSVRCGICYLFHSPGDVTYREEEGFYVCDRCQHTLGTIRLRMIRRQQQ